MNTTFFLDTEFNGHGGELLSLALVSVNGPQWYAAKELTSFVPIHPWVKQNVIPRINELGIWMRPKIFKMEFQLFIQRLKNPTIICDWHADAGHFISLLEGEDYGSSLDFECKIEILKTPPGEPVSKLPHDALEDARALMDWYLRSQMRVK